MSVSVVIPALNEGEWVQRTVDAVVATALDRELSIVLVDDGSTDGSCDFASAPEYRERVRRVAGRGVGLARARNLGAWEARGDSIVFLDAHVVPDPGWLEELTPVLQDPAVALAGLAVRSLAEPPTVGYTYTIGDENLSGGWAEPRSLSEPYEVPCVSGGCLAARRATFFDLGGFDEGCVRWGVEDVELGLRAWHLGYRCVVSPRAQVAHRFKSSANRNFAVSWDDYDVNLLRCAFTYFTGPRLEAILAGARRRGNFQDSLARVTGDSSFEARRAELRRRFRRDEAWYFERFAPELAQFETRLAALRNGGGAEMNTPVRQVRCTQCGGMNAGPQTHCLLCDALLPGGAGLTQVRASAAAATAGATAAKAVATFCGQCGAQIPAGKRFCPQCGKPAPVH